ncbi:hypothetical protein ACIRL0_03240 [Streptomyces sp. NPDC102365]
MATATAPVMASAPAVNRITVRDAAGAAGVRDPDRGARPRRLPRDRP